MLVLIAPLLALALARVYEGYLLRQTEEVLLAEAVMLGEIYRSVARPLDARGRLPPPPRPEDRYATITAVLDPRSTPLLPRADRSPVRSPLSATATLTATLNALLERAMARNLSGMRVLDPRGNVIASPLHETGYSLADLPEVAAALEGRYAPVMRERKSDEPTPPLESLSRGAEVRLSLAIPVFADPRAKLGSGQEVIGAIYASRTPIGVEQALWRTSGELRWPVLLSAGVTILVVVLLTAAIAAPLSRLRKAAAQVAAGHRRASLQIRGFAPREVHELSSALGQMRDQLEARAKYVEEFATNAVHELKTPLTSMRGAAELLLDADETMDQAQRRRFLGNIHSDAVRAADLVQRILQLARIEAQHPARQAITLDTFLDAITERYARRGQPVRVQLQAKLRVIEMEPEQLESLLVNLLDNAARHGAGEPIDVTVSDAPSGLELTVRDYGPPLPAERFDRIFERFYSTERNRGGTGLGLSIVRAIAEAHGGAVRAQRLERGAAFTVVLVSPSR